MDLDRRGVRAGRAQAFLGEECLVAAHFGKARWCIVLDGGLRGRMPHPHGHNRIAGHRIGGNHSLYHGRVEVRGFLASKLPLIAEINRTEQCLTYRSMATFNLILGESSACAVIDRIISGHLGDFTRRIYSLEVETR